MGKTKRDGGAIESFRLRQIEAVLDRIRPLLHADGVDVELVDVRDHGAKVRLTWRHAMCASAPLTMHTGLVEVFRDEIPDFGELQLVLEPQPRERQLPSGRKSAFTPSGWREPVVSTSGLFPADSVVVGHSARMRAVVEFVRVISNSDSTALISGESGTGKEVTATLIHEGSRRKHRPLVAVSCALFSETLIESELFGHERGAFTGAIKDRPGRFELAEGGTVFLDDIDDVPLSMQVKLLRVLQNRTIERLGGTRTIPVDVRILAGTKRDLKHMVVEGKFREDLYYRLNVLPVALPPLRERRDDIPVLMDHFLARYCGRRGEDVPAISSGVREAFMRYRWPGNVRELENTCERIAQTCTCGIVRVGCVSMAILSQAAKQPPLVASAPVAAPQEATLISLDDRVRDMETNLIGWALKVSNGNKSRAAELLHIKRSTLGDRMLRCGLADIEPTALDSDDSLVAASA